MFKACLGEWLLCANLVGKFTTGTYDDCLGLRHSHCCSTMSLQRLHLLYFHSAYSLAYFALFWQDLNQPKVEARLPEGLLSVSLLRHQVYLCYFKISFYFVVIVCVLTTTFLLKRIALAWMLQKETGSVHCSGGILADDQVKYNVADLILLSLFLDLC